MSFSMDVTFQGDDLFVDYLEGIPRETLHDLAMEVYWNLIQATPVDTGTAMHSWDIAESEAGIKDIEYGDYISTPVDIPKIRARAENIVIGTRSEYMKYLNEGWSQQAPALFVEKAIEQAINDII